MNRLKRYRGFVFSQVLACAALQLTAGASAVWASDHPYSSAAHDALIRDRTTANEDQALGTLHDWLEDPQGPKDADRRRVLADYVTLLSRAGRHREALDAANNDQFPLLPDYALQALFYSARTLRDTAYEKSIVAQSTMRKPDAPLTRFWNAELLFDTSRLDDARQMASTVADDTKADNDIRSSASELIGAIEENQAHWVAAARAYGRSLELNPDSRSAQRADTYLLAGQRATPEALSEALATNARAQSSGQPPVFSDVEIISLRQQAIGQQIAWAIRARDEIGGAHRYGPLDKALADSDALLAELDRNPDPATHDIRSRLLVDRLDALNAHGYYRDCTDLYESLVHEGVDVPYYGLSPVADSYAQQRRSDLAVPLYEKALAQAGDKLQMPSDTHTGLVYAYMDVGRFKDADKLLTQLEAHTPPTLRLAPAPNSPNSQYSDIRDLRARYLLFTDQPKRAESLFSSLNASAPFSASFSEGLARTDALRERPYASLDRATLLLTDHPESVGGRVGRAEGLLATGRIREGSRAIDQLQQEYPEVGEVRDAARDRDVVHAPSLHIDSEFGQGSGNSALSDRDWLVDARLESALYDDSWRIFAEQAAAYGKADNGTARRNRTGLGLSYERDRWTLEGEAHTDDGPRKQGLAATVGYRAGDHVVLGASFDSSTLDLPWKAYNAGIAANRGEASIGYIVNESRRFDASYQRMQFSDGNVSQGVQASWTERWWSAPSTQFQTTLTAGADSNRLTGTPYFSPSSDKSLDVTGRYQWLTWKRDDRSFVQRVYGSVGTYDQAGFGATSMYGARYEHEWNFNRSVVVTYGVGVLYHPYDGKRERRTLGYLNLAIPFF
jgi:poly-beta-1,6 N-acetyl-D-glucosamine export porin PgaA